MTGSELKTFQDTQIEFAAHIRNPVVNPRPADVEPRRMAIYNRLFYNNIESFCRRTFKTYRSLMDDDSWHAIIRDFIHRHKSTSPYFKDIPREFIEYLGEERHDGNDLAFAVELCHFESLNLELKLADALVPHEVESTELHDRDELVSSPFTRTLSYRWPVHRINADYLPSEPPDTPTWLIAVRDRENKVRVLESNERTVWIVNHLQKQTSIIDLLKRISQELAIDRAALQVQLVPMLTSLWQQGVLLCPAVRTTR